MNRRDFLSSVAASSVAILLPTVTSPTEDFYNTTEVYKEIRIWKLDVLGTDHLRNPMVERLKLNDPQYTSCVTREGAYYI